MIIVINVITKYKSTQVSTPTKEKSKILSTGKEKDFYYYLPIKA